MEKADIDILQKKCSVLGVMEYGVFTSLIAILTLSVPEIRF